MLYFKKYVTMCFIPKTQKEKPSTMSKQLTGHIRQWKNRLREGQYVYKRGRRSIYGKTQEEVSQQVNEVASEHPL